MRRIATLTLTLCSASLAAASPAVAVSAGAPVGLAGIHGGVRSPASAAGWPAAELSASGGSPPAVVRPTPCTRARLVRHSYTADRIAQAYDAGPLLDSGRNGEGVTVAVVAERSYSPSDVDKWASCYGIPSPQVTGVGAPDPYTMRLHGDLQIENILHLAPRAQIRFYNTLVTKRTPNFPLQIAREIDDAVANHVDVISMSLEYCEPIARTVPDDMAVVAALERAGQRGISVLVAAGNSGSTGCMSSRSRDRRLAVNVYAANPWVTAVGGTSLYSSADARDEVVWKTTGLGLGRGAGGGGISELDYMAPWQSALGTYGDSSGAPCGAPSAQLCREVPDVAADANPSTGYVVYGDGIWSAVGGTSSATPLWAGLVASMDQGCATPAGFLNPALYKAAGAQYSDALAGAVAPFHDVTVGDNAIVADAGGKYAARQGYDMASGLGTPDALGLAPYLSCAPVVDALSSAGGPLSGGDTITIDGSGFSWLPTGGEGGTGLSVDFGPGNPSTDVQVLSPTQLSVRVPPGRSAGTVDVTVSTPAGTSKVVDADHYTYRDATVVTTSDAGFSVSSSERDQWPAGRGEWSSYDPTDAPVAITPQGTPAPGCAQMLPRSMPLRALSAAFPVSFATIFTWPLSDTLLEGNGSALWRAALPSGRWRAMAYEPPTSCLHRRFPDTLDVPDTAKYSLAATGMAQAVTIDDHWSGTYSDLGDFTISDSGGIAVVRFDGKVFRNNVNSSNQIAPVGSVIFQPEPWSAPQQASSSPYPTTSQCDAGTDNGDRVQSCLPALAVSDPSRTTWRAVSVPSAPARYGEPPTQAWVTDPTYSPAPVAAATATWTLSGAPGTAATLDALLPPVLHGQVLAAGAVTYRVSDATRTGTEIHLTQSPGRSLALGTWTYDRQGHITVTLTNTSPGPGPIAAWSVDATDIPTPCTLGYATDPPTHVCSAQLHGAWSTATYTLSDIPDPIPYATTTTGNATWRITGLGPDTAYRLTAALPPHPARLATLGYTVTSALGATVRRVNPALNGVDLGDYLPVGTTLAVSLRATDGPIAALELIATPLPPPPPCSATEGAGGVRVTDCPPQLLSFGATGWTTRHGTLPRVGETFAYAEASGHAMARWRLSGLDDATTYSLEAELPVTVHRGGTPASYTVRAAATSTLHVTQVPSAGVVQLGRLRADHGTIEVSLLVQGGPTYAMDVNATPVANPQTHNPPRTTTTTGPTTPPCRARQPCSS